MWRHARFPACPLSIILRQPLWNASGQRWRIIPSSVLPAGICSSGSDRCWDSEVERGESRITPHPEARFHSNRLPKRQRQAFAARAVVLNQFASEYLKVRTPKVWIPNSEIQSLDIRTAKFWALNSEIRIQNHRIPKFCVQNSEQPNSEIRIPDSRLRSFELPISDRRGGIGLREGAKNEFRPFQSAKGWNHTSGRREKTISPLHNFRSRIRSGKGRKLNFAALNNQTLHFKLRRSASTRG